MSVEDMTQQEWDEHHKQLDKYLTGVEERHIARLGVAMGFRREWVGLTKQEFIEATEGLEDLEDCWVAIEAKLKEKNHVS